jgi:uncharacterized protein
VRRLRISDRLFLPVDWITLATVIYGARGSGKTSLAAVFAEEVSKAGQRFCAIDLKGDLYGLKSTADGKGDGIPVVIFGGDHQDVPLEDGAGAFVGETVAGLGQSCVLDLEHFSKGKQVRFLAAFFEALYDRNRDPLLLILDEGQRYAPQRPIDPDAAKCLGAVEDLVKLGRKHGIGPVILTQRGSGLNKEVSELCDMMVAFRTPGPLDQERIKDWLDANTTKVQRDEVMGKLSGLPTGTAVFASGHPDLKIFGVYPVRRRETFDSSATPKVGQRRKEPKRLAKPDLDELKSKMSAAIERQKADDPKTLRARIAELEREVKAKVAPAIVKAPKIERVEVPVLSGADRKLLVGSERWATRWATTAEEIAAAAKKWTETLAAIDARIAAVTGKPAPRFLLAPLGQPKPCAKHAAPALAKKSSNGVVVGKGHHRGCDACPPKDSQWRPIGFPFRAKPDERRLHDGMKFRRGCWNVLDNGDRAARVRQRDATLCRIVDEVRAAKRAKIVGVASHSLNRCSGVATRTAATATPRTLENHRDVDRHLPGRRRSGRSSVNAPANRPHPEGTRITWVRFARSAYSTTRARDVSSRRQRCFLDGRR